MDHDDDSCFCGTAYAPNAKFCGECGTARPVAHTECPRCGHGCAGLKFCGECGHALTDQPRPGSAQPVFAPPEFDGQTDPEGEESESEGEKRGRFQIPAAVTIARTHLIGAAALVLVAFVALAVFRGGGGGDQAVAAKPAAAEHGAAAKTADDEGEHGEEAKEAEHGEEPDDAGNGEKAEEADEAKAEAADEEAQHGDEEASGHDAEDPEGEVVAIAGDEVEGLHGDSSAHDEDEEEHGSASSVEEHAEGADEDAATPAKGAGSHEKPRKKKSKASKRKSHKKTAKKQSKLDGIGPSEWLAKEDTERVLVVLEWLERRKHGACDALPVTDVEFEVTQVVKRQGISPGRALKSLCA